MKNAAWKSALFEAGMIILSVLLALVINEWRTNYNERAETRQILDNIYEEIEGNQRFVQNLIDYHEQVMQTLTEVALQDSLEETFLPDGIFEIYRVAPKGIIQGDLRDIAWIVAKEEKISIRIPIEEAQMLFSVYEQQLRVKETVKRIIQILSAREIHRRELLEESIIVFGTELNELIAQEKSLDFKYGNALEQLKQKG